MPLDKILASDESLGGDGIAKTLVQKIQVSCPAGQNPLTEPGVPGPGSWSQLDVDLRFDAYGGTTFISRVAGVDLYHVTILYSNDRRFRFPVKERVRTDPDFREFSEVFAKVDQKIPMFRRKTEFSKREDDTIAESYTWIPDYLERRVDVRIINVTIALTAYNLTISQEIASHIDEIHIFFGGWFRMMPARVDQVADARYEVSYQWQSDPGSPSYTSLISPTRIAPGARPPFQRYVVIPAETIDSAPIPDVEPAYAPEQLVPLGYQQLPGNPIQ